MYPLFLLLLLPFPVCFSFIFPLFDSLSLSFHPLLPFVMRPQTLETYRSLYLVFYFHSLLSHQHLLPLGQTDHHHQNRAQLLLLKFSRVLPEFYHHSAIGSLSSSFQSDHHTKRILKSAADLHPLFLFLADRTSSFSSLDNDITFLYFFANSTLASATIKCLSPHFSHFPHPLTHFLFPSQYIIFVICIKGNKTTQPIQDTHRRNIQQQSELNSDEMVYCVTNKQIIKNKKVP